MQTKVLLSIKPEFASSIFSGDKKFEFRKNIFKNGNVKCVYVYASRPISRVIGEFEIKKIISADPKTLWEKTMDLSGISKEHYDNYFKGRNVAHAVEIGNTFHYNEPQTLMEMFNINRPPQSFMYIHN